MHDYLKHLMVLLYSKFNELCTQSKRQYHSTMVANKFDLTVLHEYP